MPASGEGHVRIASSSAVYHDTVPSGIDFEWNSFFGWTTLPSTPYGYARRRIEVDAVITTYPAGLPENSRMAFVCFQNDVALSSATYPDPNEEEFEDAHLIDFDTLMQAILEDCSLYLGNSYNFHFSNFRVISELQDHNHVTADITNQNPVVSGSGGNYYCVWNA